jgi:pyruvate carboxylase
MYLNHPGDALKTIEFKRTYGDPNNLPLDVWFEGLVGSPSSGDLWVVHVKPGDMVKKGEELFNISIMKQEKSILAPVDGMVERVLKFADYQEDKKMVPVKEGELLVELVPAPRRCPTCTAPVTRDDFKFCPSCGQKV